MSVIAAAAPEPSPDDFVAKFMHAIQTKEKGEPTLLKIYEHWRHYLQQLLSAFSIY